MTGSSQGTGGLTFHKTKRVWPSEMNVLLALVIIIVIFEVLGQFLPYMNDQSFLFDTKDRFDSIFNEARLKIIILQVAIIGIIALGVTQVIITAGIDLSSGPLVAATAMIAMSFGPRLGFATIMAYLAQGAMGLPVFAGGAGLAYMAGPTGGYLFGFAAAAIVVGIMAEKGMGKSYASTALTMVVGNIVIYAFGVTYLASIVGSFDKAIQFGLAPFIYGDVLKIVIATALLPLAWKFLPKA